jgi:hypothetical protein
MSRFPGNAERARGLNGHAVTLETSTRDLAAALKK